MIEKIVRIIVILPNKSKSIFPHTWKFTECKLAFIAVDKYENRIFKYFIVDITILFYTLKNKITPVKLVDEE